MSCPKSVGFAHQAAIYGSDAEFLAMATPFIDAGLQAGEPILAATTTANLKLIGEALGPRAQQVDYAETAYFGRRPIQRVTAFQQYWKRHADAGCERVRILVEPVWTGRSAEQITAWQRMESALNLALADTGIFMICPYDERVVDVGIVASARRTHPELVTGHTATPCADYVDPHVFTRSCDAVMPLPPPPDAAALVAGGDLYELRRFVRAQAAAQRLGEERAALLLLAFGEAATYLKKQRDSAVFRLWVRIWTEFGGTVCELHQPGARITDPILGLRVPAIEAGPGDGIFLARQLCDRFEIRSTDTGCTIRMHVPSARAEELSQPVIPYLG